MLAFDHYWREINRAARLWLVGSDRGDVEYRAELERLRDALPSGKQITFTGKVTDPQVHAYYRAADVFICASAHEGFCMPITQAMALDVPVLAYAATAVPETMGGAGLLIHDWDVAQVATALDQILSDAAFRERLLLGQRASLSRFSLAEARARLAASVLFLQTERRAACLKGSATMEIRPERFNIVQTAPALMTVSERVVLYSLIFGLRPQRILEIGTKLGGSALVIGAALDDIGAGQLVCVDSSRR